MDSFRRKLGLDGAEVSGSSAFVGGGARSSAPSASSSRLYPDLPLEDDDGWMAADDANSSSSSNSSSDVRQKLRSMWHNVKYGRAAWALMQEGVVGPAVAVGAAAGGERRPVWLLGRCYERRRGKGHPREYRSQRSWPERQGRASPLSPDSSPQHPRFYSDESMLAAFHLDFHTRLWFTYRREFQEFRGTTMNTDCGWGCMIRSGQMILANALLMQRFGRDWKWRRAKDAAGVDGVGQGGSSPAAVSRQISMVCQRRKK